MANFRAHIFVACLLAGAWLLGAQTALFNHVVQIRSALFPRTATGDVVVVAIDAASIQKIGVWPWPRELHAELIDKLQKAGAEDIAFDVDFGSASNAASDAAFAKTLKNAGSVILPAFKQPIGTELHLNEPLKLFRDNAWVALVNVIPDGDGVVRKYPFGNLVAGQFLPSLASHIVGGSKREVGSFFIDFSIKSQSIPIISYAAVIDGAPEALAQLKGKKVIVGSTALELGDRLNVAGGYILPGPVLQALAAESLHQNRALLRGGQRWSWLLAGLVALGMALSWRRLSISTCILTLGVLIVAIEGAAAILQSRVPVIWDTSPVLFVLGAYIFAQTLDEIDFRGMINRISHNRFRKVAMSLGDALICTDNNGTITTCNPAAETMFGCSAKELLGRPIDGLIRPSESTSLSLADRSEPEEMEACPANQNSFPVEVRISSWDAEDRRQYGIVVRDISRRKREAEKIRRLAEKDSLTGLANRYTLNRQVESHLESAQEQDTVALLLLDLDKFKEVNDTLGHAFGDKVLVAVAQRLLSLVSERDLVARLGGDEFAIVLKSSEAEQRAENLCQAVLHAFSATPIVVLGRTVHLRTSIGLALHPRDARDSEELFANADLALYRAKSTQPGSWLRFKAEFRNEFEGKLRLEKELQRALKEEEFELFYQPQIDLAAGQIIGAEALIRWRHPERGLISPGEFIPVLNHSALSDQVGEWVLRSACRQAAEWYKGGHPVRIGVNLSPSQLHLSDLPMAVRASLADSGLPNNMLELEVTEDSVLADEIQAIGLIRALQEIGVRLAFDDFGTGYASLSHLKKFRLDVLKIDRSFVMGMLHDPDDLAIVGATVALGKQLGLSVIAEGVEDAETADMLRRLGCNEAQGYHFGKPMPGADFTVMLEKSSFAATAAA